MKSAITAVGLWILFLCVVLASVSAWACPRGQTCTSTRIGDTVYTNCYCN